MRSSLIQLLNDSYFYHTYSPECSVEEVSDGSGYQVTMDLAGVKREDINIEAINGVLKISGERKGVRSYTFEKQYRLGPNLSDDIQASYTDGVLMLLVKKTEQAKARRIAIAAA